MSLILKQSEKVSHFHLACSDKSMNGFIRASTITEKLMDMVAYAYTYQNAAGN